jgi:transcriptional regulator GlxA family with amidase domain
VFASLLQPSRAQIRASSKQTDVVMSVCTGAFLLAATGLLDGHPATTHHSFYSQFATTFPEVQLQRGKRFVEGDGIATAGGLTSGIDLALRVVERYFGRDVAERTADLMEYHSDGWRDPTAPRTRSTRRRAPRTESARYARWICRRSRSRSSRAGARIASAASCAERSSPRIR